MAARVDPKLKKAYDFFKKHAGGVVGRNAEGALALARAEAVDEDEYMLGDEEEMPSEVLYAVLKDQDGEVLESLGGIGDPDRNYGRVVEAELALEALARKKLL